MPLISTKLWIRKTFLETCYYFSHKLKNFKRIPVLCYHRVFPGFDGGIWSVRAENLESQLQVLKEDGFNTLSLAEYSRMARGLEPMKERSILLTFDDGFADNYYIAWQIAQKYNIKINLFVCPGIIGKHGPAMMGGYGDSETNCAGQSRLEEDAQPYMKRFPQLWRPLTWQELRVMQEGGVGIGLHSYNHKNLATLTPQELIEDTTAALATMEGELGQRPCSFAFPYGGYNDYTPQIISLLRDLGFDLIFAAHPGRTKLPSRQLVFPRIEIFQQDDLAIFRQKIWGAYDWWEDFLQIMSALKRRC